MENVYLTSEDIKNLEKKKINEGTDGSIYRIGNGLIYKIYHDKIPHNKLIPCDNEGVKIYRKSDFKIQRNSYIPENYVKLRSKDAIELAKERQKNIKLTTLPLASIYIDNHFKGCVLKDYYFSTSIYFVKYFPFCYRLKICLILLKQIKELLDNNIYRLDLSGKEYDKSNALLNFFPKLGPVIIDNDGYSTIYSREYVKEFYQESLTSLNGLILELLYDYQLPEIVNSEKYFEERIFFEDVGVPEEYIESFIYQNASLKQLETFLKRKLNLK